MRMEEGQEDVQPMERDTDTDADSDSTIPYDMESDLDSDKPGRTKSGRVIKKKFPFD